MDTVINFEENTQNCQKNNYLPIINTFFKSIPRSLAITFLSSLPYPQIRRTIKTVSGIFKKCLRHIIAVLCDGKKVCTTMH